MSKKRRRRVVPLDELETLHLFESAITGTELGCALVAGAHIENATGSLLEKVMIKGDETNRLLNDPTGILSGAAARADMCFCLGLIEAAVYKNAKQIARIRNQFAHSHVPIGFDDEEVHLLCRELQLPMLLDQKGNPLDPTATRLYLAKANNRHKFVWTTLATFHSIRLVSEYSRRKTPIGHNVRCIIAAKSPLLISPVILFNE